MNNKVIITESRTVAKTIAQALGVNILHKGYFGKGNISVTWTGGNIITATPKSRFEFSVCSDMNADEVFSSNYDFSIRKDSKGKGVKGNRRPSDKDIAQAAVIERLWKNADVVFNAMKPSASGEVIFASLSNYIKVPRPVVRLWLRMVTRQAILEAFGSPLTSPSGYASLHDNAIAEYTIGVRPAVGADEIGKCSENGLLWDMNDLKREAEASRCWSPAKTTGVAFSLYNKGLISYPSESDAPIPMSVKETMEYAVRNLAHHPTLGHKTAPVSAAEGLWTSEDDGLSHHAVTVTGLYPVDLTPEEEHLYNIVASHCLDVLTDKTDKQD